MQNLLKKSTTTPPRIIFKFNFKLYKYFIALISVCLAGSQAFADDHDLSDEAEMVLDEIVVEGTQPESPLKTLFFIAHDLEYQQEQEREIFLSGQSTHPQIRQRMGYATNTSMFTGIGDLYQGSALGNTATPKLSRSMTFPITQKWRIAIDNDDGNIMYMFNPYLVKGTTFQEGYDREAFALLVVFPDNRIFIGISEFSSQNIQVTQNPNTYLIDFLAQQKGGVLWTQSHELHASGKGRSLKLSDNTYTGVLINKATSDMIHGLWNSHSGMNKALLSIKGTQTQYDFEIKGHHIWGYTKAFDHISTAD